MARRTKEDAEKTKQELIASALNLFSDKGVSRTTLTDIAKGAGVTKGAFYWHFKDKFEILKTLRIKYMADIDAISQIDISKPDYCAADFLGQFEAVLTLVESSADIRAFHRICMLKCEFTEELSDLIDLDVMETTEWQADTVRELRALPESDWQPDCDRDYEVLAGVICDYLSGYLLTCSTANENINKADAMKAVKLICRGGGLIV